MVMVIIIIEEIKQCESHSLSGHDQENPSTSHAIDDLCLAPSRW